MESDSRVSELEERIRQLEVQNMKLKRQNKNKDSRSVSPCDSNSNGASSERADPFELDVIPLDEIEDRDEDDW